MTDAIAIPLEIWQDPQGDVILIYSEKECSAYFGCWKAAGEPADFIGRLSFDHAWGVRSYRREFMPYRLNPPHMRPSWIWRIPESELVKEHVLYRQQHYPESVARIPVPNHFVVHGHDIYHEILADDFDVSTIRNEEVADPRLLRLIQDA
jgi:hypothetical protein